MSDFPYGALGGGLAYPNDRAGMQAVHDYQQSIRQQLMASASARAQAETSLNTVLLLLPTAA